MNEQLSEPKKKGNSPVTTIIIIVVSIALVLTGALAIFIVSRNNVSSDPESTKETEGSSSVTKLNADFKFDLANGKLSDFDIAFLKAENGEENKIYSPLSIKYALKMLEDGANGSTKEQISRVLGKYKLTKYTSNKNMSLANAFFVKDSFKSKIKDNYISNLKNQYDADVVFDSFSSVDRMNDWIKSKTLGLIPSLLDPTDTDKDFILINALGIDMEWENKFLEINYDKGYRDGVSYNHENYYAFCDTESVVKKDFDNKKSTVSGMEIFASIDNYDIVKILGEEKIRTTVTNEYRKWIKEHGTNTWGEPLTDDVLINIEVTKYVNEYMEEIKSNYTEHGETSNTDFSLYTDDDVKAFAKDLKTYNGTTLQYIGIMPTSKTLKQYIKDMDSSSVNRIIRNLKDLKRGNFKDGVITRVTGFIPKFNFDYTLNLQDDLKKIGITDVFDQKKADLSGMTKSKGAYISKAAHKATIDFTQDGIKAAAVTMVGGKG
ncbi:MAG: hypothetical protein J5766_04920, partial [Clostridia bacterium]|nr:hypothetical protein [Clostridia bacterium]